MRFVQVRKVTASFIHSPTVVPFKCVYFSLLMLQYFFFKQNNVVNRFRKLPTKVQLTKFFGLDSKSRA